MKIKQFKIMVKKSEDEKENPLHEDQIPDWWNQDK